MEAAVESNHPIGKITLASSTTTTGACAYTIDWTYDSSGRPTSSHLGDGSAGDAGSCPHPETFEFTAWDAAGRPTAGTLSSTLSGCTATTTRSYDDTNRTVTAVYSACTGTPPLAAETVVTTYDANGLVIMSSLMAGSGLSLNPTTYMIASTAQICD
jgi:hypothetical protein